MKKLTIFLAGLVLIGISVQAQKIYVRAGLGVAVSTAAGYIADYTSTANSILVTVKKQGLGTGLPFVLAAGYNLNEHFAFELGIDYFYGFSLKQKFGTVYYSSDSKWRGQMLSLVPAFVMSLPLDKFKPYARLGLKIGVLNSVVYQDHRVNDYPVKTTNALDVQSKRKDYGGIALGVQAAVGTDFILSDKLSLFGEIQVDGISWSPTHGKYLEYSENGVDQMGSRTVNENEWNYLKEVDQSKQIPDSDPDEVPKTNHRFGNVGLVIGVKVNL
jgi:hypothetical protein